MKRGLEKFYNLVEAFEELPGIGKKSALRLSYSIVTNSKFSALKLSHAIEEALYSISRCQKCGGLSEDEICNICLNESRSKDLLCITQSPKDIFIIEESGSYFGYYFVVESLETLEGDKLVDVIDKNGTKEIVFAFSPSLGSDTLILYIEDKLQNRDLLFSKIAHGIPTGVSLENVDITSVSKAFDYRFKI